MAFALKRFAVAFIICACADVLSAQNYKDYTFTNDVGGTITVVDARPPEGDEYWRAHITLTKADGTTRSIASGMTLYHILPFGSDITDARMRPDGLYVISHMGKQFQGIVVLNPRTLDIVTTGMASAGVFSKNSADYANIDSSIRCDSRVAINSTIVLPVYFRGDCCFVDGPVSPSAPRTMPPGMGLGRIRDFDFVSTRTLRVRAQVYPLPPGKTEDDRVQCPFEDEVGYREETLLVRWEDVATSVTVTLEN